TFIEGAKRSTAHSRRPLLSGPIDVGFDSENCGAHLVVEADLATDNRALQILASCAGDVRERWVARKNRAGRTVRPAITGVCTDIESSPAENRSCRCNRGRTRIRRPPFPEFVSDADLKNVLHQRQLVRDGQRASGGRRTTDTRARVRKARGAAG